MLEVYARVGRGLYRVRGVLVAGMLAGAGFFVAGLFASGDGFAESRTLMPALAFLAFLCMTVFAYAFRGAVPVVDPQAALLARLATHMVRLFWHLLALLMIGLGLATVLLTLRALLILRGEWGA